MASMHILKQEVRNTPTKKHPAAVTQAILLIYVAKTQEVKSYKKNFS